MNEDAKLTEEDNAIGYDFKYATKGVWTEEDDDKLIVQYTLNSDFFEHEGFHFSKNFNYWDIKNRIKKLGLTYEGVNLHHYVKVQLIRHSILRFRDIYSLFELEDLYDIFSGRLHSPKIDNRGDFIEVSFNIKKTVTKDELDAIIKFGKEEIITTAYSLLANKRIKFKKNPELLKFYKPARFTIRKHTNQLVVLFELKEIKDLGE